MLDKAYSLQDVQAVYDSLEADHAAHLKDLDVKLPPLYHERSRQNEELNMRALQLVYLRIKFKQLVSKEEVAEFVKLFCPAASGDQQARHLKYDGWDVRLSGKAKDKFEGEFVPTGFYVLASTDSATAKRGKDRLKRLGKIRASDWSELQAQYEHRCATCGELKEGRLEKGHMDPRLPLELKNTIPMCGACNNWAADRFIFDTTGRVVALASPKLVADSDDQVQFDIFKVLSDRFGRSRPGSQKGRRLSKNGLAKKASDTPEVPAPLNLAR